MPDDDPSEAPDASSDSPPSPAASDEQESLRWEVIKLRESQAKIRKQNNWLKGVLGGITLFVTAAGGVMVGGRLDPLALGQPRFERPADTTATGKSASFLSKASSTADQPDDDGADPELPASCEGEIMKDLSPERPADIRLIDRLREKAPNVEVQLYRAQFAARQVPYACTITFYPVYDVSVDRLPPAVDSTRGAG